MEDRAGRFRGAVHVLWLAVLIGGCVETNVEPNSIRVAQPRVEANAPVDANVDVNANVPVDADANVSVGGRESKSGTQTSGDRGINVGVLNLDLGGIVVLCLAVLFCLVATIFFSMYEKARDTVDVLVRENERHLAKEILKNDYRKAAEEAHVEGFLQKRVRRYRKKRQEGKS